MSQVVAVLVKVSTITCEEGYDVIKYEEALHVLLKRKSMLYDAYTIISSQPVVKASLLLQLLTSSSLYNQSWLAHSVPVSLCGTVAIEIYLAVLSLIVTVSTPLAKARR